MNEIAVIKAQVQKVEWAERIRQCKESGLTVTAWCQQDSINPKTYYYHLKILKPKRLSARRRTRYAPNAEVR